MGVVRAGDSSRQCLTNLEEWKGLRCPPKYRSYPGRLRSETRTVTARCQGGEVPLCWAWREVWVLKSLNKLLRKSSHCNFQWRHANISQPSLLLTPAASRAGFPGSPAWVKAKLGGRGQGWQRRQRPSFHPGPVALATGERASTIPEGPAGSKRGDLRGAGGAPRADRR